MRLFRNRIESMIGMNAPLGGHWRSLKGSTRRNAMPNVVASAVVAHRWVAGGLTAVSSKEGSRARDFPFVKVSPLQPRRNDYRSAHRIRTVSLPTQGVKAKSL